MTHTEIRAEGLSLRFLTALMRLETRIRDLTPADLRFDAQDKRFAARKAAIALRFNAELQAWLIGRIALLPTGRRDLAEALAAAAQEAGLEKGTDREALIAHFMGELDGARPEDADHG